MSLLLCRLQLRKLPKLSLCNQLLIYNQSWKSLIILMLLQTRNDLAISHRFPFIIQSAFPTAAETYFMIITIYCPVGEGAGITLWTTVLLPHVIASSFQFHLYFLVRLFFTLLLVISMETAILFKKQLVI